MSGPHVEEPAPLSTQLLAYYRELMAAHADDPITGVCAVCQVRRCEDWRFARERLLCAGERLDDGLRLAESILDGSS